MFKSSIVGRVKLLEQVYGNEDPDLAALLGFIHAQEGSGEYDWSKAVRYYRIAAQEGDLQSQHGLAGLLIAGGHRDEAIEWYRRASEGGEVECSFVLYRLMKSTGDRGLAREFLDRAVAQGHPLAIQERSIEWLSGRCGIRNIPRGIRLYFRNIPKLAHYIKANAGSYRPIPDQSRSTRGLSVIHEPVRSSIRVRLLAVALACSILVPAGTSASASTDKKLEKVVKKKHRAKRHSHDYGFLPGYVPPAGDEIPAPTATTQRHTVYSYSYGGGYWYPAAHWYGYGGPRFYHGRWNGGAFGPCWTSTPIGPMWNCGK